jgi:hypothetical protein
MNSARECFNNGLRRGHLRPRLTVDDIVDNAYRLKRAKPTRAQRLSATRATHRLLGRVNPGKSAGSCYCRFKAGNARHLIEIMVKAVI